MEEDDTLPLNANLSCKVCGEKEFEERDGFYYCQECGTKQDQVRAIEVENNEDFNDRSKTKKIKIQTVKEDKPQLTSWECYNYILRGYVEELLSFGAKEELKVMTLQVWAAYLRRTEVAFFNRKQAELPKLGVIYLANDAETLYNHSMQARKKRRKRRSDGNASCTSGGDGTSISNRDYRQTKRKLDESIYSLTTASGLSALTSSTSANSNKPIKLTFSSKARKILKKKMPVKHLKMHENDAEGKLECHKQPKSREIHCGDYAMMVMNLKHVYCILAIALNLINDDIQLCDLLRFVNEGHLGSNKVLQYFPENIANNGREMLKKINFEKNVDKYSDKTTRDYIRLLSTNIGIRKFKLPNMVKLTRRYVSELGLPNQVAIYCERLINMLPPQCETRALITYPGYEARAMAYIIFVLKLLFGLDGDKEQRMSQTAKKLNREIEQLNLKHNEEQPLLFVWSEWVQYIEMRKVIVSHFNPNFCEQFNQCESTRQVLEQMSEEVRLNAERENLSNDVAKNEKTTQRLENMRRLFDSLEENFKNAQTDEKKKPMQYIEFKPSFTPGSSYFKSILLHCDHENSSNSDAFLKIPEFMRIDHTQRDVNSYLKVKPIIEYFQKYQKELKVYVLSSNQNRSYVGVFRLPRSLNPGTEAITTGAQKPCFKISEAQWCKWVTKEVCLTSNNDLEYTTDFNNLSERAEKKNRKKDRRQSKDENIDFDLSRLHPEDSQQNKEPCADNLSQSNSEYRKNRLNLSDGHDIESMHSFDLFKETNMDPIQTEDFIKHPRRNLGKINLFDGISDEESILIDAKDNDEPIDEVASVYSNKSTVEDFTLSGQEEFIDLNTEIDIKDEFIISQSREQTSDINSQTSKEKPLKFHVSNMDCWMLLGSIQTLKNRQKVQLKDAFPGSFSWLLDTCAQTLNVDWSTVYEHLLCIELMFCMGIEDPEKIENCIFLKSSNPIKEFHKLVNLSREKW